MRHFTRSSFAGTYSREGQVLLRKRLLFRTTHKHPVDILDRFGVNPVHGGVTLGLFVFGLSVLGDFDDDNKEGMG